MYITQPDHTNMEKNINEAEGWVKIYAKSKFLKFHFYRNGVLCGRHAEFIPLGVDFREGTDPNNCKHCIKALNKKMTQVSQESDSGHTKK